MRVSSCESSIKGRDVWKNREEGWGMEDGDHGR